mgnify:CR=1 FL=1
MNIIGISVFITSILVGVWYLALSITRGDYNEQVSYSNKSELSTIVIPISVIVIFIVPVAMGFFWPIVIPILFMIIIGVYMGKRKQ